MTKKTNRPKPKPNNPATSRGGGWNPIRLDKPLFARLPQSSSTTLANSLPSSEDTTTLESSPSNSQLSPKRLPKPFFYLPPSLRRLQNIRLPNWQVLALIGFVGAGTVSAAALFRSPSLPNCPSIFWPMASASLRLYCAQIAANKQTPHDLLEAITLVQSLPPDHPLQSEVKKYLEEWSQDLLDVADDLFHQGRLLDAIQTVVQIPTHTEASKSAQKYIKRWQSIWTDAVKIYQEAEAELREGNWRTAFRIGSRLTFVGNNYWETTQFEALNRAVKQTRQDITQFWEARDLVEAGGVSNLLEAIHKLSLIPSNSYLSAKVLDERLKVGNELLELAQVSLDRQDLQEALNIVSQVPNVGDLPRKARDLGALANAEAKAWNESSVDLLEAIAMAQKIDPTSLFYERAQKRISRWQSILTAVPMYEQAQKLAALGQVDNLRAAIAQANQISRENPLWKKVAGSIDEWQEQVALIEDRPVLDEAIRTAQSSQLTDLESAIAIASRIQSGRPLSAEARDRIQSWTTQVQRIQDQPLLDQARSIASQGDLGSAIGVAKQIGGGRTLSSEAQGLISEWQSEISGQRMLGSAQQAARSGTIDGLTAAIQSANQVPRSSSSYSKSLQLIDQWSSDILGAAEQAASYNLEKAIDIARRIPPNAGNYSIAQDQIQTWRKALAPPPAPVVVPEAQPAPSFEPVPVAPLTPPSGSEGGVSPTQPPQQ